MSVVGNSGLPVKNRNKIMKVKLKFIEQKENRQETHYLHGIIGMEIRNSLLFFFKKEGFLKFKRENIIDMFIEKI
jgi:hypothetical protein